MGLGLELALPSVKKNISVRISVSRSLCLCLSGPISILTNQSISCVICLEDFFLPLNHQHVMQHFAMGKDQSEGGSREGGHTFLLDSIQNPALL